jgi:hypothetical protein
MFYEDISPIKKDHFLTNLFLKEKIHIQNVVYKIPHFK